ESTNVLIIRICLSFQRANITPVDAVVMRQSKDYGEASNGSAPSIDGELCAMNETGTIRRQEDNGISDLVRCSRTARWRLGGQLLEGRPHCVSALRARRPR